LGQASTLQHESILERLGVTYAASPEGVMGSAMAEQIVETYRLKAKFGIETMV
jgi:hypothetical protein